MIRSAITRRLSIRLAGEAVKIGQALGYELETINKFAPNEWVKAMDGDEEMINNMENTMEESAVGRSDASRPSMAQDIAKKENRNPRHKWFVVEKSKRDWFGRPREQKVSRCRPPSRNWSKKSEPRLGRFDLKKLFFCWTNLIDVTTIQIFVTLNIILS